MPKISENALLMSVQAIHQLMEQVGVARDATAGAEQADYDEMIEAYEITAMELRKAYEAAIAEGSDLPPYESLLG
jgi:hypothetical protein